MRFSKFILAAALLLGPCAADAQNLFLNPLPVMVAPGSTPLGYQQITSLGSATALTVPTGATFAVVVPETQGVRYRDDGTNPTASVGMPIPAGTPWTFTGAGILAAVKFIEQTSSAKLDILYYK
jgi:hypothetical protein